MKRAAARHILVDSEQECLALKSEILAGADFQDIAKKHSKCPSNINGGALGSFGQGQMVAEFDNIVFSADLHTLQGPVKTQFGFHLLEVISRTE